MHFLDDISFAGFEDALVIDGEDLLEDTAFVLLHLAKGQVCHQSHLFACGRDGPVGRHQRLRKRLFKDSELIDITLKPVTTEEHISADGSELGSIEVLQEASIQIERHIVIRSVDGHDEVMPAVISDIACYPPLVVIVIEKEVAIVETDERTLRRGCIGRSDPTGTEERAVLHGRFEPEDERLVLFLGPAHQVAIHDDQL